MERGWVAEIDLLDTPQVELIRLLSKRVPLYGPTSTTGDAERDPDGHIRRWEVAELSLSPAPQNLFATVF